MIAIFTTCLFATAGFAAATTIFMAVRHYGPEVAQLREQITALNDLEKAELQPHWSAHEPTENADSAPTYYNSALMRIHNQRLATPHQVWLRPNLAA